MTNLFLEYEQDKKTKENPKLLVGQTRYWSKSCYQGSPLKYRYYNVFRIFSVTNDGLVKYRYLYGNKICSEDIIPHILAYSSIVPTNDESIS